MSYILKQGDLVIPYDNPDSYWSFGIVTNVDKLYSLGIAEVRIFLFSKSGIMDNYCEHIRYKRLIKVLSLPDDIQSLITINNEGL